jgi:hypothetical protein
LRAAIEANKNNVGPIMGRLGSLNPYDTTGQTLKLLSGTILQNISKTLEGGKLTDADRIFYQGMLPTEKDTPEAAIQKIEQLERMNAMKRDSIMGSLESAGFSPGDYTSKPLPKVPSTLQGVPPTGDSPLQQATQGLKGLVTPKPQGSPSPFKTGDVREKGGVKYQRQENGKWLPLNQ